MACQAASWFRSRRQSSPSGVQKGSAPLVMRSQNVCRRSSRRSGGVPAMIALLMAPIDTPDSQSGR